MASTASRPKSQQQRLINAVVEENVDSVFALLTQRGEVRNLGEALSRVQPTEKGVEICGLLIAAGADVNFSDPVKKTNALLVEIASAGPKDFKYGLQIGRLLIAARADLNKPDYERGYSPLATAFDECNLVFAQMLLECGAAVGDAIFSASSDEAIQLLLRHGADVNQPSKKSGNTPLIKRLCVDEPFEEELVYMAWIGVMPYDQELIEALVKNGANPQAVRASDGANGIHCMATGAKIPGFGAKIAETLIENGLPVDHRNTAGYTVRTYMLKCMLTFWYV